MADDLLFHRMADIAVRAVLQIAVRGGIALKTSAVRLRAVCKAALSAELVERPANKQMVAVVEQNRLTVWQALAAFSAVTAAPSVTSGSATMRAAGQYALIFSSMAKSRICSSSTTNVRSAQSTNFSTLRAAQ